MTVTLPAELAGLLAQTGQSWPDADEDQLTAMADGWKGLQGKLVAMRASNNGSTQAVLAANQGPAVAAFGDWAKKLDGILLQLVGVCARVEAALITAARAVLTAKKAVVNALAVAAKAITTAKNAVRHIPFIGGLLSDLISQVVEPIFNALRELITQIVDAIADLVVNTIMPILVQLVRTVEDLLQNLRKLITNRTDQQDWPTNPSGLPNLANKPTGPQATWTNKDDATTKRARRLENEAAVTLAQDGYQVQQLGGKNPDYRIEGQIFDCAAPESANAYSIWSNIQKNKIDKGQTQRMIINLNTPDAKVSVDALRQQFQDHPMPGLKEVKVIASGGAIIEIYP